MSHVLKRHTLQNQDLFSHAPKLPCVHLYLTFRLDGLVQDRCISTGAEIGCCGHRALVLQDLGDTTRIIACLVNSLELQPLLFVDIACIYSLAYKILFRLLFLLFLSVGAVLESLRAPNNHDSAL